MRLWDVATGKSLGQPLAGHVGDVNDVAVSSDGRTLASAGDDHTVRLREKVLWRDLAEVQREICAVVVRGLGPGEWRQYAPGIPYRPISCP